MFGDLSQDLRYALRTQISHPGFTLVVVLTLAVGIGLNTTIFTWVKGVILQPLPGVERSDRLLTINGIRGGASGYSNSYPDYEHYRDRNTVFSGLIAHEIVFLNLGFEGDPDIVIGGLVSGNYFDVLGVSPMVGRAFLPEEDRTINTHPVAVIGYHLWQRRFGGDRGAAGRTITLNGRPFTIVGVAPQGFAGVYGGLAQEIWVPLHSQSQLTPGGDRLKGERWLQMMGRLKDGASKEQADAEMSVLASQLAEERPQTNRGWGVRTYALAESKRGFQAALSPVLKILMAVVGFILLIACANVGSLLLARSLARRKEITIRLALGADRARLVRQLLTESLLLALMGGAAGFLLAIWMTSLLRTLMPPMGVIEFGFDLTPDTRVLLFTLLVSILTGVLFGLAPALQSSNLNLAATLSQEMGSLSGGRSKSRLRGLLVVLQIALSCITLIGAGLFIRTLQKSLAAEPGFDIESVAVARLDLFLNGYEEARGRDFYQRLTERLEALPGIEAASMSSYVPLSLGGGGTYRSIGVDGENRSAGEPAPTVVCDNIGPGYLRTLGIGLVAGREFASSDSAESSPVAVINEALARRYWPQEQALGKRLRIDGTWHEIIGIAKDAKYRTLIETPAPQVYLPASQNYQSQMIMVARTAGAPAAVLPAIEKTVREMDPNLPLLELTTLEDRARDSLYTQRAAASLLAVFGLLALGLSAAGLYGVMSYLVTQHTREIGIRMALGAARRDIFKLVIGQGMALSAAGLALGLAGAFAVTRLASSLLFGVTATDLLTFIGVSLLLLLVALLSCYVPARRAVRVNPMIALRYE